jgi:hypothetical protein
MATTLNLLNKVLRGLRQFDLIIGSSETSVSDDYLLMLLQFVNEAKEEIEDAGWPWYALRVTHTVTLAASTVDYTLTAAGDSDIDTSDRTRLLYENVNHGGTGEGFYQGHSSQPQCFDVTTSAEYRLTEVPLEKMERWHLTDNDETGKPTHFAVYAASGNLKMKVYPTPDQAYTLKMRFYDPQDELADTDITTVLSIPTRPVYLKALLKANQERGSELGAPDSTLDMAYRDAHGAAVANEMTQSDETVHLDR